MRAREGARALGHGHVGAEHLLLALVRDAAACAGQALRSAGVSADDVLAGIVRREPKKSGVYPGEIPFSASGKRVLALALDETLRLGHDRVESEHLLLGITDLRDAVAIDILADLGVGPETARDALGRVWGVAVGQSAVSRERVRYGSAVFGGWAGVAPSEQLERLLKVAADRAGDGGRADLQVRDLVLVFTLASGPASLSGIRLSFNESLAAAERDRAWIASAAVDPRAMIWVSDAARRLLMAAAGVALIRGSSVVEVDDANVRTPRPSGKGLLLVLLDDEHGADLFSRIGLNAYRAKHSLIRGRRLRDTASD
jgi:hypothetical protein